MDYNEARMNEENAMRAEVKNIERKVVSIEEMLAASKGELVDLPSFNGGETFTVRLRRPSMLQMIKTGKIPNDLLIDANRLFTKGTGSMAENSVVNDPNSLKDMMQLLETICESAFVEPTYQEIKGAGIELTDSQMLAVFEYTQNGVGNLKSFH